MKLKSLAFASVVSLMATPSFAQVTSVAQLRDVQPTDWAYGAIQNLVERYSCVAGYPNGTFKPGQPATRAELAALTSACLDNISTFVTAQDAAMASALRAEFNSEIAKLAKRVTTIEVSAARKAQGVGSYLGAGATFTRQGVAGNGFDEQRVIGGATVQGRLPLANAFNGQVSLRPFVNFAGSPEGLIGAAGGALATFDLPLSRAKLADGSTVSRANLYLGGGAQFPFVNNTGSNFQSTIGNTSQVLFVVGAETRVSDNFVLFADVKLPTKSSGVDGTGYAPVGMAGAGWKF